MDDTSVISSSFYNWRNQGSERQKFSFPGIGNLEVLFLVFLLNHYQRLCVAELIIHSPFSFSNRSKYLHEYIARYLAKLPTFPYNKM